MACQNWPCVHTFQPRCSKQSSNKQGETKWLGPAALDTIVSRGQAHLGPKYVGLWDFMAQTNEELSFQAGNLFRGQEGRGMMVGHTAGFGGRGPG